MNIAYKMYVDIVAKKSLVLGEFGRSSYWLRVNMSTVYEIIEFL